MVSVAEKLRQNFGRREQSKILSVGEAAQRLLYQQSLEMFYQGDDSVRLKTEVIEGKQVYTLWWGLDSGKRKKGVRFSPLSSQAVNVSYTGITHNDVGWVPAPIPFERKGISNGDREELTHWINFGMSHAQYFSNNGK